MLIAELWAIKLLVNAFQNITAIPSLDVDQNVSVTVSARGTWLAATTNAKILASEHVESKLSVLCSTIFQHVRVHLEQQVMRLDNAKPSESTIHHLKKILVILRLARLDRYAESLAAQPFVNAFQVTLVIHTNAAAIQNVRSTQIVH